MNAKKDESLSQRDTTEAFHSVLLLCGSQKLNLLDQNFNVSPRGMTFTTDSHFAPFTDLSIRLKLPPSIGALNGRTIQCEGVVVECRGSRTQKIYHITVAFLNLSPSDQKFLSLAYQTLSSPIQPISPQKLDGPASFR